MASQNIWEENQNYVSWIIYYSKQHIQKDSHMEYELSALNNWEFQSSHFSKLFHLALVPVSLAPVRGLFSSAESM